MLLIFSLLNIYAVRARTFEEILHLKKQFLDDHDSVKAAKCFEQKLNCSFINASLVGMSDLRGKSVPIFTEYVESKFKLSRNLIYRNQHLTIALNDKDPYYSGNDTKLAARCYAQLLILPNARIYNAVTLNYTHIPLINEFRFYAKRLINIRRNRVIIARRMRELFPKKENINLLLRDENLFLNTNTIADQLKFYAHYHPNGSVGHLHVHGIFENLKHGGKDEEKNTPLSLVTKLLRFEEAQAK